MIKAERDLSWFLWKASVSKTRGKHAVGFRAISRLGLKDKCRRINGYKYYRSKQVIFQDIFYRRFVQFVYGLLDEETRKHFYFRVSSPPSHSGHHRPMRSFYRTGSPFAMMLSLIAIAESPTSIPSPTRIPSPTKMPPAKDM